MTSSRLQYGIGHLGYRSTVRERGTASDSKRNVQVIAVRIHSTKDEHCLRGTIYRGRMVAHLIRIQRIKRRLYAIQINGWRIGYMLKISTYFQ
jgi:hypothetical protein